MFHQPWSGRFNRAHLNHHLKQYPPTDFYSDKYRDPGNDSTFILFAIVFAPIVATTILLTIIGIINLFLGLSILVEMAIIGFLNDSMHDSFHLRHTFWHRFKFFDRLIRLHYNHHTNMRVNFGIFTFLFDRIFGTYNDTELEKSNVKHI